MYNLYQVLQANLHGGENYGMTVLVDKGRVTTEGYRHEQINEIMDRVAEVCSRFRAHSGFLLVESSFKNNTV